MFIVVTCYWDMISDNGNYSDEVFELIHGPREILIYYDEEAWRHQPLALSMPVESMKCLPFALQQARNRELGLKLEAGTLSKPTPSHLLLLVNTLVDFKIGP